MSSPDIAPEPTDDEPRVPLEDLERAADLLLADRKPAQPREPVNSR